MPTKAYLFCYFTGEGPTAETIRFALSMGNNALEWRVINDDKPVLESVHGEKGLRDPFIMRSHRGDRFYLLASDLNTYRNGWATTQQTGSRHIEIWESTDLIDWGTQRHVKVSSDCAGNSWAPEAVYDDQRDYYVVFWASNLYPTSDDTPRDADRSYNRMIYATTRDFRSFSAPQIWIDDQQDGDGNGTIDSTVIAEDGWFYRFTVPEGANIPRIDRSRDLYATVQPNNNDWRGTGNGHGWQRVQARIGYGQRYRGAASGTEKIFLQGEGTTVFRPNIGDVNGSAGVYAFIDQADYYNDGEGYVPFWASSVAAGDWTIVQERHLPLSARHGTVLPITVAEYEALLSAYQPDQLVRTEDVTVATRVGETPALPSTVGAALGPGTATQRDLGAVPVSWEPVDPALVAAPGMFVLTGSVTNGGLATATVTVDPAEGTGAT